MAVLGAVGNARAQSEAGPIVELDAPATCPTSDAFRAHLLHYLGGPEPARGVRIEIVITRTGASFELTWKMQSEAVRGERTLSGEDCAVLVETAALTAALAIDPNAVHLDEGDPGAFERHDDERPPKLESIPDRLTEVPDTRVEARRRPRRLLGLVLRAAIGGDAGGMPGPFAPWVGAAVGPRWGAWRLEFTYSYWFEREAQVDENPDKGGNISLWATSFRTCRDLGQLSVLWSACLGIEGGKMAGHAFGVDLPEANSDIWLAGSGALAGSLKLANYLYLRTEMQAVVPAWRLRFVINPTTNPTVVHQPWYVNLRLFTGLELQFR